MEISIVNLVHDNSSAKVHNAIKQTPKLWAFSENLLFYFRTSGVNTINFSNFNGGEHTKKVTISRETIWRIDSRIFRSFPESRFEFSPWRVFREKVAAQSRISLIVIHAKRKCNVFNKPP